MTHRIRIDPSQRNFKWRPGFHGHLLRLFVRTSEIGIAMPRHKILIVDDNRDFRGRMRHQLESWGYEVMEAENGSEGVQMARDESPDLLLLDYHMPYIRGVQIAKAALAQCSDLHVLFLTPDFELSFLKEMVPTDTHFMSKPFEMEDLQRNITHMLH